MDTTGLYEKFSVSKNEGRPPFQGQHFVLYPGRDVWAYAALVEYSARCAIEAPTLATDIDAWLNRIYEQATPAYRARIDAVMAV